MEYDLDAEPEAQDPSLPEGSASRRTFFQLALVGGYATLQTAAPHTDFPGVLPLLDEPKDALAWLKKELKRIQKSATAMDRSNNGFWLVDHLVAFLNGNQIDGQQPFVEVGLLPHNVSPAQPGVNHAVVLAVSAAWCVLNERFGPELGMGFEDEDKKTLKSIRRAFARYIVLLPPQVRDQPYDHMWLTRAQRLAFETLSIYFNTQVYPGQNQTPPHLVYDLEKSLSENIHNAVDQLELLDSAEALLYLWDLVSPDYVLCDGRHCIDNRVEWAVQKLEATFDGQVPNVWQGRTPRQSLLALRNFLLEPSSGSGSRPRYLVERPDAPSSPIKVFSAINVLLTINSSVAIQPNSSSSPTPQPVSSQSTGSRR